MSTARVVTLLLLHDGQAEIGLRLIDLCTSASLLGANMRLATNPAHVMKASRRDRGAAHVLVVAGLHAPDNNAVELISALGNQPSQGVIVISDTAAQVDQALAAGADWALPSSVSREEFLAEIQWLLNVYGSI